MAALENVTLLLSCSASDGIISSVNLSQHCHFAIAFTTRIAHTKKVTCFILGESESSQTEACSCRFLFAVERECD